MLVDDVFFRLDYSMVSRYEKGEGRRMKLRTRLFERAYCSARETSASIGSNR